MHNNTFQHLSLALYCKHCAPNSHFHLLVNEEVVAQGRLLSVLTMRKLLLQVIRYHAIGECPIECA